MSCMSYHKTLGINTRFTSRDRSPSKVSLTSSICLPTMATALASIIPSFMLKALTRLKESTPYPDSKVRRTYFTSFSSRKHGTGSKISPLKRVACTVSVSLADGPCRTTYFLYTFLWDLSAGRLAQLMHLRMLHNLL